MGNLNWTTPIEYLKGVGPAKADSLKKALSLFTLGDLLQHYPFRYIDRSRFYTISELDSSLSDVQIVGEVMGMRTQTGKGRQKRLHVDFSDGENRVELVWFQGWKYLTELLSKPGKLVVLGKPNYYNGSWSISHPEIERLEDFKSKGGGLHPVYHSSEKLSRSGLHSKGIGQLCFTALREIDRDGLEFMPTDLRRQFGLTDRYSALVNIHFPKDSTSLLAAQQRIKFEEFFLLQLNLVRQKQLHSRTYKGFAFEQLGDIFNSFYQNILPFELTGAQKRVLREIRRDVQYGAHMNRLVQGDVGSGKTIVALMAMLMALDNGYQACMMAPTEILANQHYNELKSLCSKLDISVGLLTGHVKGSARKEILAQAAEGQLQILVGTHALIEDKVVFANLGLAVVDEQHRFGVAQRAKLWQKNSLPPHVLVMTATPIPRTLAMAVYGDLDVSQIDELPPGRKPIKTVHRSDANRLSVFQFMRDQIAEGRQVYVVYPLIEESESLDYKDLMDGYDSITRAFPQPDYQVSIVHGRMKSEDKEFEMQRFVSGQTQIMVATTVIEVGVNVPNASVMLIESAERFGLSQLHQLRGRVGRGADASYCILMTKEQLSADAKTRIQTMVRTNDGFEIAETDMRLRGPGDLMGTRQSGILDLKLADISSDSPILQSARQAVEHLLSEDPDLKQGKHRRLLLYLQSQKQFKNWGRIS